MISLISNQSLSYPNKEDFFSPHIKYPEYKLNHISNHPNSVYDSVRHVFIQAGLDKDHVGTPNWNPLGKFIQPGSRFLFYAILYIRGGQMKCYLILWENVLMVLYCVH